MVLYRKYRPSNFDDLIGQDHIVTTLKNALKHNRVAHAYLFAGPRGTGKTSTARILAGQLGVEGLDLIEIDAASHRGIDSIRELREQVNFMPSQGAKKLYILDEAHMLTNEAFNALLKTLEEPPAHVHLVLCTTEPHKLPLTIISRCQRFDFNLADEKTLAEYVASIAKKEEIKAEEKVFGLLARLAQGSFRDALGFLESLLHHPKGQKLTLEQAQKVLGLVQEKEAAELNQLILEGKTQKALTKVGELAGRGVNFYYLVEAMVRGLREQLVAKGRIPLQSRQMGEILSLIRLLHRAASDIKTSPLPQLPLEMVVVEWGLESHRANQPELRGSSSTFGTRSPAAETASDKSSTKNFVASASKSNLEPRTGNLQESWPKILELIKPHNHSVEALLKGCQPAALSDNILTLQFYYRFHKERIEEARNRELVEKIASEVLGQDVQIRCELGEKKTGGQNLDDRIKNVHETKINQPMRANPDELLQMAQEVFGGEIIE